MKDKFVIVNEKNEILSDDYDSFLPIGLHFSDRLSYALVFETPDHPSIKEYAKELKSNPKFKRKFKSISVAKIETPTVKKL